MAQKLHVAIVWHMHQPLYKDRLTGKYLMPWVRLHALKDYLDMVTRLKKFPAVKQTFNLVPSLLEQLEDYAAHDAWDRPLELLVKPIEDFTREDREFLLARGFDLNPSTMVSPYPRYVELQEKRARFSGLPFDAVDANWTDEDWQDLITWFNLAWIDPLWLKTESELIQLVAKQRGFTMGDRQTLLFCYRRALKKVIPFYRDMAATGQIELTTTPYYHPILPLLCDTNSARVARPELPLPDMRFKSPEDARHQIDKALASFKRHFGHAPKGMWPSEQSISPEALELIAQSGLQWAISDEGILAHTLTLNLQRDGRGLAPDAAALYQPYNVMTPAGPVAMVFRDVTLSDAIGFRYAAWPAEAAAQDLHGRLNQIRKLLPDGESHVVTIALDGENCWEHYANDGADFLDAFYRLMSSNENLEMVTVGQYLEKHPPRRTLETIFSGSWIGSDFTTWIGDPIKNRAWEMLGAARAVLEAKRSRLNHTPVWEAAWEEIYIAEGSDWFWWFGEGHNSGQDDIFDWQFRFHLQNVYHLINEPVPDALLRPIAGISQPRRDGRVVAGPDGKVLEADWERAALYDATAGQGAMHAAAKAIQRIRYGLGKTNLHVAVEFSPLCAPANLDGLALYFCYPGRPRNNSPIPFAQGDAEGLMQHYNFAHALHVPLKDPSTATLYEAGEYGSWHPLSWEPTAFLDDTLELTIPLAWLQQPPGQEIQFVAVVSAHGALVEVLPADQPLQITVPVEEGVAHA